MSGFNRAVILGHLGADPELRYGQSGQAVASLRVATNEVFRGSDGNRVERTEWHRVVCFRRLAEICREYLHKGDPALIEGRLRTRKWTDAEGRDHFSTEIVASDLRLLGGTRHGARGAGPTGGDSPSSPPPLPAADGGDDEDVPF